MSCLALIIPSLLIFWTITEGRNAFTSEQIQIMKNGILEKELNNWKPLLEKMNDRKKLLTTNCQYLIQHHKEIFSLKNFSNYNSMFFIKNSNSVICDTTGLTQLLFCPPHQNSPTCTLLQSEEVKMDYQSLKKNTFLVVQHPFKRIVSIFKRLSSIQKKKIQEFLRLDVDNEARGELLFTEFITFFLHEKQTENKWLSLQRVCSVCSILFEHIIYMEEIQEEKNYLLYRITGTKPPYQSIDDLEMVVPSDFEVNFYFSKLQKGVILKLYQLFRLDFELFNYKFNNYMSMGVTASPPRNGKIKKLPLQKKTDFY